MKQEREESNEASNYQGAVTCHLFLFPGEHLGNPLEAYFSYPGTRNKDVFPLSSASRYPSFRPSALQLAFALASRRGAERREFYSVSWESGEGAPSTSHANDPGEKFRRGAAQCGDEESVEN